MQREVGCSGLDKNVVLIFISDLQKLPGVFLQHRPALVLEGVAPPVDHHIITIMMNVILTECMNYEAFSLKLYGVAFLLSFRLKWWS